MGTFRIEFLDGGLAVIDPLGNAEWIDITIIGYPSEQSLRISVDLVEINDSNLAVTDPYRAGDIRRSMSLWLHNAGYAADLYCDYRTKEGKDWAMRKAVALRDRFLAGDRAPFDAEYCVSWLSATRRRRMDFDGIDERPDIGDYVLERFDKQRPNETRDDILNGIMLLTRYSGTWGRGHKVIGTEEFKPRDYLPAVEAV